jgi:hypothetical protein
MIATLLTFFIVGVVALVLIGVVMSIIGAFVGLAFTLLFKVVPILIVGYVMLRLLGRPRHRLPARQD